MLAQIKLINRYIGQVSRYAELRRLKLIEPVQPNSEIDYQGLAEAIQDLISQSTELQGIGLKQSHSSFKASIMRR